VTAEAPRRRRGIYVIGDDELARLLQLPAGQQIVSVSSDWVRNSMLVLVEGEGLPEVAAGCEAPTLNTWGQLRPLVPLDVSRLSPGAAHAAVLAELAAVRFEDPDALAGRRRILERHARNPHWKAWTGCSNCVAEMGGDPYEWPCVDYLDAAAGLVTGLPRQAEYEAVITADLLTEGVVVARGVMPVADAIALLADPNTGRTLDAMMLGDQTPAEPLRPGSEGHRR
jgi:hypothetical protein